jgi:hypothetical protein
LRFAAVWQLVFFFYKGAILQKAHFNTARFLGRNHVISAIVET